MSAQVAEQQLIAEAVSGDAAALNFLLADCYERLRTALVFEVGTRLGEHYSAEDCVQDAYVYVFAHIGEFEDRGPDSFFNWLKQIARNKAIDAARAQAAAKRGGGANRIRISDEEATRFAQSVDAVKHDPHTPSRSAAGRELAGAIRVALARLKENEQQALILRFFERRDWGEIAEQMSNTVSGVRSLCHRAFDKLEETLGGMSRYLSRH
jgi:RNA polymerase sigma factor (sigma-70 family)